VTAYTLNAAMLTSFTVSGPPACSSSTPTEQVHISFASLALLPI